MSLDALKRKIGDRKLFDYFEEIYDCYFDEIQKNFVESLAGYSLVCYFLQLKDR